MLILPVNKRNSWYNRIIIICIGYNIYTNWASQKKSPKQNQPKNPITVKASSKTSAKILQYSNAQQENIFMICIVLNNWAKLPWSLNLADGSVELVPGEGMPSIWVFLLQITDILQAGMIFTCHLSWQYSKTKEKIFEPVCSPQLLTLLQLEVPLDGYNCLALARVK